MGFFDSTSATQSASGTAGAQSEQGDALSLNISPGGGLKNSTVLVQQQIVSEPLLALTENISGAVVELGERGFATAERAIDSAEGLSRDAVNLAADSVRAGEGQLDRVLDFASEVQFDSARFRDAAVENQTRFTEEAFRFAGDRAGELAGVSSEAIIRTTNIAEDALNQSLTFARDIVARESTNEGGRIEAIASKAITGAGVAIAAGVVLLFFVMRK